MTGSGFFKPIDSDIGVSKALTGGTARAKHSDRQNKLDDLKARIASGQYHVDLQTLAQRIHEDGVLDRE